MLCGRGAGQARLCLLWQPVRGARQELPAAVLFLPNLYYADLCVGDLALKLGLRYPKVPNDRGVADHLHRHLGKFERLDRRAAFSSSTACFTPPHPRCWPAPARQRPLQRERVPPRRRPDHDVISSWLSSHLCQRPAELPAGKDEYSKIWCRAE